MNLSQSEWIIFLRSTALQWCVTCEKEKKISKTNEKKKKQKKRKIKKVKNESKISMC